MLGLEVRDGNRFMDHKGVTQVAYPEGKRLQSHAHQKIGFIYVNGMETGILNRIHASFPTPASYGSTYIL